MLSCMNATCSLMNKLSVAVAYIDFYKAFDTVCHVKLFCKLKPNSITLSGSNQLRISSEPASVMEFGFYSPWVSPEIYLKTWKLSLWLMATYPCRGSLVRIEYKSSAVAEMGDRGHNRHGPKREGVLCPFHGAQGTRLIQCGLRRCVLPYQVASSSIQPFGHNGIGCHSPHRNISTNYYLVVEMHSVTVRSDDAWYLLN